MESDEPVIIDLGYGTPSIPYWNETKVVIEYRNSLGEQCFLTPRQVQSLAYSVQVGTQEAAHRMGISIQTLKHHLSILYRKLAVYDRFEAMVVLGWVELPKELVIER